MKKFTVAMLLALALGIAAGAREAAAQVSVSVSIGGFYDELSPYGEWVDCTYGSCWVPRGVRAGWQPYTNGEWIYTTYGWTWVSYDSWGASPYHYGTWVVMSRYGWVWVPGTVWAPAWVTWCYNDRYIGWAPLPPTVAFGSGGYSGRAVVVNQTQYVFVPTNRFVGTNVASARLEPGRNAEIFRYAKPVTRFDVSGGIVRNVALPVATVQRATGARVVTREIGTARTTPRTMSSGGTGGGGGPVAIVAPPREVKSAHADWQGRGAPKAHQEASKAQQQPLKPQQQAPPPHQQAPPPHQQAQHQQPPAQVHPQPQPPPQPQPQAQHQPPPQHGQGHEKGGPPGGDPGKEKPKKD